MALHELALTMMAGCFKPGSVLSLGYPDILVSRSRLRELFHVELSGVNPGGETARRLHAATEDLVDTSEFFARLSMRFACVDVKVLRGCETVVDLNAPHDLGVHDLVIDPGTLEHCFNIGCALMNAVRAVKTGGHIFHGNPVTDVNHGFYCLNPTWYWDFYTQNGWTILDQRITVGNRFQRIWPGDAPPVRKIGVVAGAHNLCLARRDTDAQPCWPTQSKYKEMLQ